VIFKQKMKMVVVDDLCTDDDGRFSNVG